MRFILPILMIVVMLGGQLAISAYCLLHKLRGGKSQHHLTWPWLDYPMYSKASGPPIMTQVSTLYAEMPDGSRFEVTQDVMGLKKFAWRYNIVERLTPPPVTDAGKAELAALVEEHRIEARDKAVVQVEKATGQKPVRFIVERTRYQLEDHGIKKTIRDEYLDVPETPGLPGVPVLPDGSEQGDGGEEHDAD